MRKLHRITRPLIPAVLVVTIAVGFAAITDRSSAPAKAGASRVQTKLVAGRRTVPIGVAGLNETWAANTAVWYAGAKQAEAARAAATREEAARRARDSASHATTSGVTRTTSGHDASQFGDDDFDRVALCETGGDWSHQTAFDGGLGIAHGNWNDLRTGNGYDAPWPALPEWGSQASRELQIAAARKFIGRYGVMGWGCHAAFFG